MKGKRQLKGCILSMQRVMNYGSLLQAYALSQLIKKVINDVNFIDIDSNMKEKQLMENNCFYNESESFAGKSLTYRFFNQDNNCLYSLAKILKKKKMLKKQEKFATDILQLNPENNRKQYDYCVIGSDEVFNCLQNSSWGFTSQLFGNVKQAKNVITYAASCGFTKIENVPNRMKECINNAFKNIKAFSVRDSNTLNFVSSFGISNISLNLDPVLIYDFDREVMCNESIRKKLPKRYCIIYAYEHRIYKNEEISEILKFCKKNKMVPVSIGGTQKWVHKHLDLTPFEVLVAFKYSSFVITDTFHGTIFSTKYADKFGVIIRESNANKLGDLVNRLNINEHCLKNMSDLNRVFRLQKDEEKINNIICKAQEATKNYLEANLC